MRYFARELPKRHKNAFHATILEQFERAVAELDAAIPSLQDHQIIVKLHQIAGTIGDGHTGVRSPAFFKRYPINVYWFGRELRVIAATRPKLVVSWISTRYYQFVDENVPAVLPDERIDPSWADFRAGRDAVMDWILSRPAP